VWPHFLSLCGRDPRNRHRRLRGSRDSEYPPAADRDPWRRLAAVPWITATHGATISVVKEAMVKEMNLSLGSGGVKVYL